MNLSFESLFFLKSNFENMDLLNFNKGYFLSGCLVYLATNCLKVLILLQPFRIISVDTRIVSLHSSCFIHFLIKYLFKGSCL